MTRLSWKHCHQSTVEASQRADEWCAEILDVVDEHHGLSRSGAASVRVIGCRASPELAKRFRALGLTDIDETSDGIIAWSPDRRTGDYVEKWARISCQSGTRFETS